MTTSTGQPVKLMDYYKRPGVKDLRPMKVRGFFAKALLLEDQAGKTTPGAEEALQQAINELE